MLQFRHVKEEKWKKWTEEKFGHVFAIEEISKLKFSRKRVAYIHSDDDDEIRPSSKRSRKNDPKPKASTSGASRTLPKSDSPDSDAKEQDGWYFKLSSTASISVLLMEIIS